MPEEKDETGTAEETGEETSDSADEQTDTKKADETDKKAEEKDPPVEGEDSKDEKEEDNVQKRIDALTFQSKSLEEDLEAIRQENAELRAKVENPDSKAKTGWDAYSDEELEALAEEKPEYKTTVRKLIAERMEGRIIAKTESNLSAKQREEAVYGRIQQEMPEFLVNGTPEFKLADSIYRNMGLKGNPNGPYIAAKLAKAQMGEGKVKKAEVTTKKLDKELGKKSLASGKQGKPAQSLQSAVDKAFEEAQGTEPGSTQWIKYFQASGKAKRAARGE